MGDTLTSPSGAVTGRRVIVFLGASVATLVFFLFLTPYILPASVEKSIIETAFEKVLQRRVAISGDAAFTILPTLKVSADNIVIPGGGKGEAPVLMDIAVFSLEASTLSLLRNTISIHELTIDQPVLRLSRDDKGRSNWQGPDPQDDGSSKTGVVTPDYDWGWWRDLQIGTVRLTNGRFVINSRMSSRQIKGEGANLEARVSNVTGSEDGVSIAGSVQVNGEPVKIRFDLGSVSRFLLGGRVPLIGNISAAPLSLRYQGVAAKRQYLVTEGLMSVDASELSRLGTWLGANFSTETSGGLHWKARVIANGNRTAFQDMHLDVGESRLAGNAQLNAATDGRTLEAHIQAENLNLTSLPGILPSVSWFEGLAGSVQLKWKKGSYRDLHFGDGAFSVDMAPKKHRLVIELSRMKLYGGRANGSVKIAKGEGMTSVDANFELMRVNSEELFGGLQGVSPLAGKANLSLDVFSVGSSRREILAALRGRGEFNITQGSLVSPDLAGHLRVADDQKLSFTQLIGSFSVEQGIVEGRDLLLKAPNLSLIGDGIIDLSQGFLDIHLQSLSRRMSDDGKKIPTVRPFRLRGPLAAYEIISEEG